MKKVFNILFLIIALSITLTASDKSRKISKFPLDNFRALLNYGSVRDTLYTLTNNYIDVNLKAQAAYIHFRNGDIRYVKISSGSSKLRKGVDTKEGLFVIQSKMPKWYSRQFDSTLMLNWMGFNNGIGFHALAGNSYYRNLGLRKSSHGCIRISREDASDLFEKIKIGTPVLVHNGNPAVAIQFADTTEKYTVLNHKGLLSKHTQRLNDLYEGKYMLYYGERFLINKLNVSHNGIDIGDASKIPDHPIYYPYFIDLKPAEDEILSSKKRKIFKMVEAEKLSSNFMSLEKRK